MRIPLDFLRKEATRVYGQHLAAGGEPLAIDDAEFEAVWIGDELHLRMTWPHGRVLTAYAGPEVSAYLQGLEAVKH